MLGAEHGQLLVPVAVLLFGLMNGKMVILAAMLAGVVPIVRHQVPLVVGLAVGAVAGASAMFTSTVPIFVA